MRMTTHNLFRNIIKNIIKCEITIFRSKLTEKYNL